MLCRKEKGLVMVQPWQVECCCVTTPLLSAKGVACKANEIWFLRVKARPTFSKEKGWVSFVPPHHMKANQLNIGFYQEKRVGTKPGLWTLDWTMDWTVDWIMAGLWTRLWTRLELLFKEDFECLIICPMSRRLSKQLKQICFQQLTRLACLV